MSFPLRVSINAAKFALGGKWKPTWIPKYLVPLPFGIHFNASASPHSKLLSLWLAQMAVDLLQLTLAPDARQKVLRTSYALSMLAGVPFR